LMRSYLFEPPLDRKEVGNIKSFMSLVISSNEVMPSPSGKKRGFPRLFVIGIDGATFEALSPLIREGVLPTLAEVLRRGSHGELESTIPPVTIPAWVSMVTGKNPGKLGLFDLLKRRPGSYGVTPAEVRFWEHTPFWSVLNKYGISTGLLNIPGTYPPRRVEGFMVTGMFTPSERHCFAYPPELVKELNEVVSHYDIDVGQWQYFDEGRFLRDLYRVTEKRRRALMYLTESYPCDFYMAVFTCTDRLQHVLWKRRDLMESYWSWFDSLLGEILRRFGEETTFFMVSDHGFGPIRRTFYVNEWLRRMGYLAVKRDVKMESFVKIGRVVENLYYKLGRFKVIYPLASTLNKLLGMGRLRYYTYDYLSKDRLVNWTDWSRTRAFALVHTPHYGHIYINVKGRMPQGCVDPKDYEEVREEVIGDLSRLRDPSTGEAVKIRVYRREEVYEGPHVEEAPDIIFVIDNFECEVDPKLGHPKVFEERPSDPRWTGTHKRNGVFMAYGPDIREGHRIEGARITDVAPTILHLLGAPIPGDVDGKVLLEIFEEGSEAAERPPVYGLPGEGVAAGPGLGEEDRRLVMERLRRLGYIG